MSPVLLRPIREQFEHNRVIRLLQGRLRRRYAVGTNIGDEPETTGVTVAGGSVYPDLVLHAAQGPRRVHGIVEVETNESVNRLEAMAEWVPFGKVRGAFYLYVPSGTTDVTRRLCEDHGVDVTEIWSYHTVGDQMRFTMAYRSPRASAGNRRSRQRAAQETAPSRKKTAKKKAAGRTRAKKAVRAAAKAPAKATKRVGKAA